MAKGAEAKQIITKKILETFEGSFQYDKEIRIPIVENGEVVQIKVTLTCAKVNVENGSDNALPEQSNVAAANNLDLTDEEKSEVVDLISRLGL